MFVREVTSPATAGGIGAFEARYPSLTACKVIVHLPLLAEILDATIEAVILDAATNGATANLSTTMSKRESRRSGLR